MKVRGFILALASFSATAAFAQVVSPHPIRIIGGLGTNGALGWTNYIPTTVPVYEVLRASTVTSAWSHFLFVTNQHNAVVTNALAGAGEIYHKLAWVGDTQTVFNYVFDEGFGVPAVIGQLNVTFVPGTNMGVWFCAETQFAVNHFHPTGSASFWGGGGGITLTPTNHAVRLYFTPPFGDMGVFLEGTMTLGTTNGRSIYTGFAGEVFENRFGGPERIGTFTATRSQ
jgi:hypothetical protein